ncbi:hypothetical protein HKX48_007494 [Thoreauomyces humboldtii]|nr:hypothetical protein HKX48_007494 [Thoreauomyces humboldtii]
MVSCVPFRTTVNSACGKSSIRLISFDKPGVGLSGSRSPSQDDRDPFEFVADLVLAIADHLAIAQFGVRAFSLGAMDVLALASRHPHRIVSTVQIFGTWTMPYMPHALTKMKMLTKVPESWIRGCVGTATSIPFDPKYAWLMTSVRGVAGGFRSLAGASANLLGSCIGSEADEKDDGLEDGVKEERAFKVDEPAVDHATRLVNRIFAWSCIWAKKPQSTWEEALMATKAANPKTDWDGGWDVPRLLANTLDPVFTSTVKTPLHFYYGSDDEMVSQAAVEVSYASQGGVAVEKQTHESATSGSRHEEDGDAFGVSNLAEANQIREARKG